MGFTRLDARDEEALEALSVGQRSYIRAAKMVGIGPGTYDKLVSSGRGCRPATVAKVAAALAELLRTQPEAFRWRAHRSAGVGT